LRLVADDRSAERRQVGQLALDRQELGLRRLGAWFL